MAQAGGAAQRGAAEGGGAAAAARRGGQPARAQSRALRVARRAARAGARTRQPSPPRPCARSMLGQVKFASVCTASAASREGSLHTACWACLGSSAGAVDWLHRRTSGLAAATRRACMLSGPMRCSQPPRLHRSLGCLRRRAAPGLCAAAVAAVRCTATELCIVERGEGPYALLRTAGARAAGAGGRAGECHALATAELPAAAAGGRSRAARPAHLAAAAARARAGRRRRPGWRGAAAGPRGRRAALPPAPGRRRRGCRRLRRPRHARAGESLGLAAAKRVVRSVGAAAPATSVLRMRTRQCVQLCCFHWQPRQTPFASVHGGGTAGTCPVRQLQPDMGHANRSWRQCEATGCFVHYSHAAAR